MSLQAVDSKALMVCSKPTVRDGITHSHPGAFFGTTFAHLFFQSYRELAPAPFWKPPSRSSNGAHSSSVSNRSSSDSRASPFVNPNPHGGQKRAAGYVYVPRIYGFKVSERAKSGPRMQWLRLRPQSPDELEMVDWRGRWLDEDEDGEGDEYDEDEDESGQMEDFDPVCAGISPPRWLAEHKQDAVDEEEDEEEEEEDEDEERSPHSAMQGQQRQLQFASASTENKKVDIPYLPPSGNGRVKVTRQWVPAKTWAVPTTRTTAQVC